MKIKGTRDYIDVSLNGRVARFYGEMVLGGFIANADSLTEWLIPPESPISPADKEDLINRVIAKTKGSHMVITFEYEDKDNVQ